VHHSADCVAKRPQYHEEANGDERDHDRVFDEPLTSFASAQVPDAPPNSYSGGCEAADGAGTGWPAHELRSG
jgi:hypothetical protein